jgi:uncharacterized protein (TIGR02646 family)
MRFVNKPNKDKTTKLSSIATYNELLEIARKNSTNIKDSIYRDSYKDKDEMRSKVEDQLALSYHNKCAYCERLCKADVEHYRPKKGVKEDSAHGGYYWLCYEWTNLLPACVKCNRDGAKLTKFPILGKRQNSPSFLASGDLDLKESRVKSKLLISEKALLLHPEVDKPEDFFEFEIDKKKEGIRIKGIDKDKRGENTIDICLLNRQELRLERVENVINHFKISVESVFAMHQDGEYSEAEFVNQVLLHIKILVKNSTNEKSTHTYLRKYIVKSNDNFKNIVIPFFPVKLRKIVFEAFKSR